MAFPILAAVGLGSTLLKAFGKKKQEDAKAKLEREQAQNQYNAQKAQFGQKEDARIAALKTILSQAGARGINMGSVDPSLFQKREYTGAAVPKNTGKSTFGSIASGIGDIGLAAGDLLSQKQAEAQKKAELDKLMCVLNPMMCSGDPEMGPPISGMEPPTGLGRG